MTLPVIGELAGIFLMCGVGTLAFSAAVRMWVKDTEGDEE